MLVENLVLDDRAEEVAIRAEAEEVSKIIEEEITFLKENTDALFITAPQLGYNKRIFAINFNGEIKVFINPMITKKEGFHFNREKNVSFKGREFIVPRFDRILADYQKPNGMPEVNKFEGPASEIFEQAVNILDGITIADIGLEIDELWDQVSDEERQAVLEKYAEQLKDLEESCNKDIEEDPELKQQRDAIRFMTSVASGETELYREEKTFNRATRRALKKKKKK